MITRLMPRVGADIIYTLLLKKQSLSFPVGKLVSD